jgi:quinol monooxygenase YgiN
MFSRLKTGAAALALTLLASAAQAGEPVIRIAELEIDPAQLEAYKTFLAEEIETSVKVEPGVLSLSAVALKQNAAQIRILEVYADQDAYEAHIRSPHFLKYKNGTAKMVRSLTLHETAPVRLCAKGQPTIAGAC